MCFSNFQVDEVDAEKLHTLKYSSGGVLSNKSAQTQQTKIENNLETKQSPPACNTLNPSDLPFIDEDERELDEAIRLYDLNKDSELKIHIFPNRPEAPGLPCIGEDPKMYRRGARRWRKFYRLDMR